MSTIGLFFGSDEGNTESVAKRVQSCFSEDSITTYDIADVTQIEFIEHELLILGVPTWDFGQIQSDWEDFWEDLEQIDFHGKTVALFGLGDQFGYGDYFLDAMGMLHDVIVANGATVVGRWSADGYEFEASKAYDARTHEFVGLALDEDQQEALSDERIRLWCQQLRQSFGLAIN